MHSSTDHYVRYCPSSQTNLMLHIHRRKSSELFGYTLKEVFGYSLKEVFGYTLKEVFGYILEETLVTLKQKNSSNIQKKGLKLTATKQGS